MTAKVVDWFRQVRTFLLDVQAEFKRVTWLDLKQTAAQTVLALIFVFFVALYLGIVDLALSRIINYLLKLGF